MGKRWEPWDGSTCVYTIRAYVFVLIFQWFSVATPAKMNNDEPDKASPEVGHEGIENFPIREPRENFCTILPGYARGIIF